MANYFMWDYKYPEYSFLYDPKEMQENWNQTLVTAINNIDNHLSLAKIPSTKHIIIPKKFKCIFESMVFYDKLTDNLGKLANRFSTEFDDCESDYINVCGVPLKIENFV